MAGNINYAAFAFDEKVIVVRRIGVEVGFGAVDREFADQTGALELMQRVVNCRQGNAFAGLLGFRVQGFRSDVTVAVSEQQAAGGQLRLRHVIDDGAIFYLNGQEVDRFNMDAGPVNSLTTATESVNNAVLSDFVLLPTDDLVPGVNRFSVEVHQGTPLSADVLFGVELSLVVEVSPARPPTPC